MLFLWLLALTWTFDEEVLKQKLPPEVSIEELSSVLKDEGIDVVLKKTEDVVLWHEGKVTVHLAKRAAVPYHLWIDVDRRERFEDCSDEEYKELYRAVWIARKALQTVLGAKGFMIFATDQPRHGKTSSWAGIEILPSCEKSAAMDAFEKIHHSEYYFYNILPENSFRPDPRLVSSLENAMHSIEPALEPEMPLLEPWVQRIAHHEEGNRYLLEEVRKELVSLGALIEGELPEAKFDPNAILEQKISTERCAFCNEKIVQNQLTFSWEGMHVLTSYKAVTPHGHFLIIPERHQCAWDITPEEALASFQIVAALNPLIREKTGENNWFLSLQDGPVVGQTVPHTHLHLYPLPPPLKAAMTTLQHVRNKRRILSHEEIQALGEPFKNRALEYLEQRKRG